MTSDAPNWTRREALRRTPLTSGAVLTGGTALVGGGTASPLDRVDLLGETIYNPCTDEEMLIQRGTFRSDLTVRGDGAGGFHVKFFGNYQGVVAVGEQSGRTFHISESEMLNENFKPPFPRTKMQVSTLRAVAEGPTENYVLRDTNQYTVDANGTVTVDRFDSTESCG